MLRNLLRLVRLPFWPVLRLRASRAAQRGSYLLLELDGRLAELPRPDPFFWRPRRHPAMPLSRIRKLARELSADRRAAGLVLRIQSLPDGLATLASLREALAGLVASGKDVVVHLPRGADTRSLFVASAARRIIAGPETSIAPLGFAVAAQYVRRALDRAGIEAEVLATGPYKAAGEMLVRDGMSEAQREQLGAVLDAHQDLFVDALVASRRVERAAIRRWMDEGPYHARDALALGLVDDLAYDDELDRVVARHAPPGAVTHPAEEPPRPGEPPARAVRISAAERFLHAKLAARVPSIRRRPVIGVVEVHGVIVPRLRFAFAPAASEERVVGALRRARESAWIRGVILHVDSQGGSALASDRIHHEVVRLAAHKPIVAYLGNVAASGGYYVAAGTHLIVAQPQSITGSIGVVAARIVIGALLDRFGVTTEVVKRGARADLYTVSRPLDEGERAALEREIAAVYRSFVRVVAEGRRRPVGEIEALAGGRVWSGLAAHARGLVDRLGGFERAVAELRTLIGPEAARFEPVLVHAPRAEARIGRFPFPLGSPDAFAAADETSLLRELAGGLPAEVLLALHLENERALTFWPGPTG